ncbi:MAG: hypothetical protein ABR538_13780 [Candidatus Binatia bacterium]
MTAPGRGGPAPSRPEGNGRLSDDLTTATDLHRPSLYAAFGNKEALYSAAVDRYVATIGRHFLEPLANSPDLARGLEGFYAAVIDTVTGEARAPGMYRRVHAAGRSRGLGCGAR